MKTELFGERLSTIYLMVKAIGCVQSQPFAQIFVLASIDVVDAR